MNGECRTPLSVRVWTGFAAFQRRIETHVFWWVWFTPASSKACSTQRKTVSITWPSKRPQNHDPTSWQNRGRGDREVEELIVQKHGLACQRTQDMLQLCDANRGNATRIKQRTNGSGLGSTPRRTTIAQGDRSEWRQRIVSKLCAQGVLGSCKGVGCRMWGWTTRQGFGQGGVESGCLRSRPASMRRARPKLPNMAYHCLDLRSSLCNPCGMPPSTW